MNNYLILVVVLCNVTCLRTSWILVALFAIDPGVLVRRASA
jgi:hypothetical protein